MHIPIRPISAILAPLAREDAFPRRSRWHRRNQRIANKRKLALFIQPCAAAATGRKELVCEGSIDNADDGLMRDDEADGDTEHGEDVGVVYGAV